MNTMGIKSMTGHGSSEISVRGVRVVVELSSVNHRQLELRLVLPDMPASFEALLAERIRKGLARGFVTCRVRISPVNGNTSRNTVIDDELARSCVERLRKIAGRLNLKDDLSASVLTDIPDVIRPRSQEDYLAAAQPLVLECLKRALSDLLAMRRAEGDALRIDVERRMAKLRKLVDRIAGRAPIASRKCARTLLARIKSAGLDIDPDDPRLAREAVSFADKSDVSEEITRLRSHMQQSLGKLSANGPVGRTLDFLVQEMHREINTVGAKANDSGIASDVILFKSELERVREQIQNVE